MMRLPAAKYLYPIALSAVWVMALAWPWELFQRLPGPGMTLVKLAALVILAVAALQCLRNDLWRQWRTGLEYPIALMALAAVLSLPGSLAPVQSLSLMLQYLAYLLLFQALVLLLRSPAFTIAVGQAFVVSSALVSLLALACAAGWAFPALATPNAFQGYFISPELRSGALMRMAATTDDFNQGVLCFLLAFPMALFFFLGQRRSWASNIAGLLLAGMLLAGIVVSFSRSSMLALLLMLAVAGMVGLHHKISKRTLLMGLGLVLLIALPILLVYHDALAQRFLRGILTRDASFDSRMYVFEVGWRLLPQYFWLGTGLGASDVAIQSVADPARLQGITTHSVPFKLLLETGILGLIAYLWLWAQLVRLTWKQGLGAANGYRHLLGLTLLCVYAAAFFVMLVQPFMALSLFPLLAAMSRGPLSRTGESASDTTASAPRLPRPWMLGSVSLLVVLVVAFNVYRYQATGQRLDAYVNALYEAVRAEETGDWPPALENYAQAQEHAVYNPVMSPHSAVSIRRLPYYDIARKVPDLHYLHRAMGLGEYQRDPVALGDLGLIRVRMAVGEFATALERAQELTAQTPDWAVGWFYRAEAAWRAGQYRNAITAYQRASDEASDWRNQVYARRLEARETQIQHIQEQSDAPEAWVQAGILHLLISTGRWEEAKDLAAETDNLAESCFVLGIAASLEGDTAGAQKRFQQALDIDPGHFTAARALDKPRE